MKLSNLLILALLSLSMLSFGQEKKSVVETTNAETYVENEFIIWLEQGVKASDFAVESNAGISPKRLLSKRLNIWLFEINDRTESHEAKMDRLSEHSDVRVIQNNHTNIYLREAVPNDPSYGQQWESAIMQLPQAWETFATGGVTATGDTIVVAVIDGGADLAHEDLSFWKNTHEIPNNGIDDDGNGYVDDYDGWDAYYHDGDILVDDHGTHVSGIIGAIGNNGKGICGVNWNVKILPVCGSTSDESIVLEAYSYVLEMRARYNETNGAEGAFIVATNSSFGVDYGHPEDYPIWCSLYDEMGKVGMLSCVAGPNMNVNVDEVGDIPSTCPGDYLIGITNTTIADIKYTYAGYGINNIDIGSPGTNIYSTLPNDQYGNMTGTSMATPHVSGTIALMYAAMPEMTMYFCKGNPEGFCFLVRESLLEGADHLPSLDNLVADARRLNAFGAIERMNSIPLVPVLTGEAKIDGETIAGRTLTAVTNLSSEPIIPDLGELSYQWLRNSAMIEGAVSSSYKLTASDVDAMISVQVTAGNCSEIITSPEVGPVLFNFESEENAITLFNVYPNPASGSVTVEGTGRLVVTNILGQTILTQEMDGQTTIELPKGLYFAKMDGTTIKVVVE